MTSKLRNNYLPEFAKLLGLQKQPSMVTVNLTNQCNQNCIYCEIGQFHPSTGKNALSFEDIIWLLDEMDKYKIKKISLCGGEPFLFKNIIDIVAYAGERKIGCTITSNGMTIHKLADQELNTLKKYKTEINISIDSFQENVQIHTRGNALALSNALLSVEKLIEKKIPVTVLCVISKFNYGNLSEYIATAYSKNINQVLFQPVIYWSNYPDMSPVNEKTQFNIDMDNFDLLKEQLIRILKFEKKNKISTNVYRLLPWIRQYLDPKSRIKNRWFFEDVLKKFYCRDVYAIIDISYDGDIQPCCLTPAKIRIQDNRQQGLMEQWMAATSEIRENLGNGKYYEYCNSCCNHFSRNMLASIMKYPLKNRIALIHIIPLFVSRIISRLLKRSNFFLN